MIDVAEICERLNGCAEVLARELLPNGKRQGNYWVFSGIEDHGQSFSAYVILKGANQGHWKDEGNAAPGEERGDMLDLVQLKVANGDKRVAVAWAKSHLGIAEEFHPGQKYEPSREERERRAAEARARQERQEAERAREREAKARQARALWLSGEALGTNTAAARYLAGRAIAPVESWPRSLRFRPDVWCVATSSKQPAMLASVIDASGEQIGCHRTYLQPGPRGAPGTIRGWRKLDIPKPKMMLGNKRGGFISISKGASGKPMRAMPEGEPVYVTEGIEDALCVRMLKPEARIVAAIDLGNVGAMVLPERARRLILVADRDDIPKALATLERSIAQQQARGIVVEFVLPPAGIKDINDWIRAPAETRRA